MPDLAAAEEIRGEVVGVDEEDGSGDSVGSDWDAVCEGDAETAGANAFSNTGDVARRGAVGDE